MREEKQSDTRNISDYKNSSFSSLPSNPSTPSFLPPSSSSTNMLQSKLQTLSIRQFNPTNDLTQVEILEQTCQSTPSGKLCILTDDLGDPLNRIRHSPAYLMLVAEIGNQIVGIIRGCIKIVTCGKKLARNPNAVSNAIPVYTKVAYLLGLRVSPLHRRMGVGLKLVQKMEDWFEEMVNALCNYAHNLARESGCGAVVVEVSGHDLIRLGIPHWKSLSCDEDVWCIKRLGEGYSDGSVGDWTKSPPGVSIFVDPREF